MNVTNLDLGEFQQKLDDVCASMETLASFPTMLKAMMQRQLSTIRQTSIAESPYNYSATNVTAAHDTRASLLVTGFLIFVGTGATNPALILGNRTIPLPLTPPFMLNPTGLGYIIQGTDAIQLTSGVAATMYIAAFGQAQPNAMSMEQL